ncbi:YbaB/EbfC family nucleoid-associated protein [Deltaproteobacteria bacterium Smac51]|nr:YbaB/EbfC family nucleoid-associated protein [Deltaproteobacteria bacterium Smac51]
MGDLVKQAQEMQKRVGEMQAELASRTVTATSGGGMVTVVANGSQEIISIKMEKQIINPDDPEMLSDLVLAAVNEALKKSQEMVAAEMSKLTGGLKLPGLFG